MSAFRLSVVDGMKGIDRGEWDGLVDDAASPFLSWGFLALLEASGSIAPDTGWTPLHFLLRKKEDGALAAAAPFYAKVHSMGEFVFDFEFARAAEQMGVRYYPKLVGMVPATPVPFWRVLTSEASIAAPEAARVLLDAAVDAARGSAFGGVQINWPNEGFEPRAAATFRVWNHAAFLWTDEGYGDFAGYLDALSKNMRRNIRRERTAVAEAGIETRIVGAAEAAADTRLLPLMADLYEKTNDQFGPWGAKFLTRDFFLRLPEFLPTGWVLSAAFRDREPIALALLFENHESLFGRYWGTKERIDGLHFELCYYLPIEYALARGLSRFDPGMGSEHKARRGFRSALVPSYHAAFDQRLDRAFERYFPRLDAEEAAYAAALNEELPFKKTAPARGDPA